MRQQFGANRRTRLSDRKCGGLQLRLARPDSQTALYVIRDTATGSPHLRLLLLSLVLLSVGGKHLSLDGGVQIHMFDWFFSVAGCSVAGRIAVHQGALLVEVT